jgi:Sec-independent protein translocase protein TatA
MNFLNIGVPEILLLLVLALLVLGPEKLKQTLTELARKLNRLARSDQWRTVIGVYRDIRQYPAKILKEVQLEEVQKQLDELNRKTEQELRKIQNHTGHIPSDITELTGQAPEAGQGQRDDCGGTPDE